MLHFSCVGIVWSDGAGPVMQCPGEQEHPQFMNAIFCCHGDGFVAHSNGICVTHMKFRENPGNCLVLGIRSF